jgi:diamine N-acetyltransferase
MVGFTELAYEPGSLEDYWIFHFFIDLRYQRQGYGKEGLRIFLQFIKDHHPRCQAIQLTVHPENAHAIQLYTSAGFLPTGTELSDEPVYRLDLTAEER